MAKNVDLSLSNFLIPNLANFIHEFGTKVNGVNQGLSTEQIVNLDMMIYRQQQAILVDENITCTSAQVQSDRKFIFTNSTLNVALDKASFAGIKLTFIADFQNGSSTIEYLDSNEQTQTMTINAREVRTLYADRNGYFKEFNLQTFEQPIEEQIGE